MPIALILVTSGLPTVSVPVLSKAITFTVPSFSIISPPLISMPCLAPLPIPATIDTGVDITKAPGHAITSRVSASSISFVIMKTTTAKIMMPGV